MIDSQQVLSRLAHRGAWRLRPKRQQARPNEPGSAKATPIMNPETDLTFPDRLHALAEKFYQQALTHPAFVFMTPTEIRKSIEHRLWSIAQRSPIWFGCGSEKKEATEAQRMALQKARERKAAIRLETHAPYIPETAGTPMSNERK